MEEKGSLHRIGACSAMSTNRKNGERLFTKSFTFRICILTTTGTQCRWYTRTYGRTGCCHATQRTFSGIGIEYIPKIYLELNEWNLPLTRWNRWNRWSLCKGIMCFKSAWLQLQEDIDQSIEILGLFGTGGIHNQTRSPLLRDRG